MKVPIRTWNFNLTLLQAVGRKMTCPEFIENLSELNDGVNFHKDVLKAIYQAIKAEPIEWAP